MAAAAADGDSPRRTSGQRPGRASHNTRSAPPGVMQVRSGRVRAYTPTPKAENLRYGANTSCVEVRVADRIYIFDCGTGFRMLGQELTREFGNRPFAAHIFVSHFHWDHIQGMPFFRPLYENPQSRFSFHSSGRTRGIQQVMAEQMASPYFPVDLG